MAAMAKLAAAASLGHARSAKILMAAPMAVANIFIHANMAYVMPSRNI